ncbi:hypothetical protein ACF08N_33665 [Streptomyces sp. NPDC015127]|uniref:hypothetical protein n=1 Tax=Streptomyces sp. NPDC015127 TaxID=3364939 RepID=UPI0037025CD0
MTSQFHTERLREAFTEAGYDITPSPAPLAAIETAGRARRRRRTAALATACGLLLVPLAVTAIPSGLSSSATPAALPAVPAPRTAQVVAPGERVEVMPQVQLWLTKDGKHWSTPEKADQFRSVTDGNLDKSRPGVSLQTEPVGKNYFLSGVYHGKGNAATVKIETAKGTVTGTIVRLAGETGWGTWYAISPLPDQAMIQNKGRQEFINSVTVYDTAGHTIAQTILPGYG